MPILGAEPDCYPVGLFEGTTELVTGQWWVVHTKPRQEKALARSLTASAISYYLPTISRRCSIRGRVTTAQIPLFPGYVFLHADHQQRVVALTTNRIVRCLEVVDQDRLWADLRQVNQLIVSGLPITPESQISIGSTVQVISGPLAGLQGTVLKSASGRRFLIKVDFIQRGASVSIDDFALESLDRSPRSLRTS